MLKFPIIINVIFTDHVLDARQFFFFNASQDRYYYYPFHKIGIIIIPADVETETKATNT